MEKFLNKKFNLTKTSAAEKAPGANVDEKIESYLSRVEDISKDRRGLKHLKDRYVNNALFNISSKEKLDKLAIDLYELEKQQAINEGHGADIPNQVSDEVLDKYREEIKKRYETQRQSLERIFQYVLDNEDNHPNWFRYFMLRSIRNMGTFNSDTGSYSKRTDTTIAPFIDLNHEAVGFVRKMIESQAYVENINLTKEEIIKSKKEDNPKKTRKKWLQSKRQKYKENIVRDIEEKKGESLEEEKRKEFLKRLESQSFEKLYAYAKSELYKDIEVLTTDGKWRKFEKNSDPNILEEALQNKRTGWCTASGSAPTHIEGGDFYVYNTYTKEELEDKENGKSVEPTQPVIAIRMLNGEVYEVRGTEKNQNIYPEFVDIARDMYRTLPGGDKFEKKHDDMNKLTEIYKKFHKNEEGDVLNPKEELTKEDITFIYELEDNIEGFGYQKDSRIAEIRSWRDKIGDLEKIYGKGAVAERPENINENTRYYGGNLDISHLDILKNVIVNPFNLGGSLDLRSLQLAEGLNLPERVGGDLYLESLQSAEGINLPKSVGGSLDLRSLESAEGLNLPKSVGGYLSLGSLQSAEGLNLPESVGGDLDLGRLSYEEKEKLAQRYPKYKKKIFS